MILNALARYGEMQIERGVIPRLGWSTDGVKFAIELDDGGKCTRCIDLREERSFTTKNAKTGETKEETRLVPMQIVTPYKTKHSNADTPFFLNDNVAYLFGFNAKKDKKKNSDKVAEDHGASCVRLHERVLQDERGNKHVEALLAFLNDAQTHKEFESDEFFDPFRPYWEDFSTASGIVFCFCDDGTFAHEDPVLAAAWDRYYQDTVLDLKDGPRGDCLITGEKNAALARLFPPVKNAPYIDQQGAYLVSFNMESVEYKEYEQGLISPMSSRGVELAWKALNYMMTDRKHYYILDRTARDPGCNRYLFWSEGEDDKYTEGVELALFHGTGMPFNSPDEEALFRTMTAILTAEPGRDNAESVFDLSKNFFILQLHRHKTRLVPAAFLVNTFGEVLRNLRMYAANARIATRGRGKDMPAGSLYTPNVADLMYGMRNSAGDPLYPPDFAEKIINGVLTGHYDQFADSAITLLLGQIARDKQVEDMRAAMLKLSLLGIDRAKYAESATESLNPDCTRVPYLLGRLFFIVMALQEAAIELVSLENGIKKQYFGAAAASPQFIYPVLLGKMQVYLTKIGKRDETKKTCYYYRKVVRDIFEHMGFDPTKEPEKLPRQLTPEEQAEFYLGYHHQHVYRYTRNNDKNNDEEEKSDD